VAGTQGLFDALVLAGLLVTATGVVLLGLAIRADPAFGKRAAWLSMLLGSAGLAAGIIVLVDPKSLLAAVGIFALICFHRPQVEGLPSVQSGLIRSRPMGRHRHEAPCLVGRDRGFGAVAEASFVARAAHVRR
jgi:hypothetical protein